MVDLLFNSGRKLLVVVVKLVQMEKQDVELSNAYFGFTAIPNTVVNIGKQGLTTPYTVALDINGNEQNGTGILALSNIWILTFG